LDADSMILAQWRGKPAKNIRRGGVKTWLVQKKEKGSARFFRRDSLILLIPNGIHSVPSAIKEKDIMLSLVSHLRPFGGNQAEKLGGIDSAILDA